MRAESLRFGGAAVGFDLWVVRTLPMMGAGGGLSARMVCIAIDSGPGRAIWTTGNAALTNASVRRTSAIGGLTSVSGPPTGVSWMPTPGRLRQPSVSASSTRMCGIRTTGRSTRSGASGTRSSGPLPRLTAAMSFCTGPALRFSVVSTGSNEFASIPRGLRNPARRSRRGRPIEGSAHLEFQQRVAVVGRAGGAVHANQPGRELRHLDGYVAAGAVGGAVDLLPLLAVG